MSSFLDFQDDRPEYEVFQLSSLQKTVYFRAPTLGFWILLLQVRKSQEDVIGRKETLVCRDYMTLKFMCSIWSHSNRFYILCV